MTCFEAFISYASEDSQYASELAGALKAFGLRIWYAEDELKVGDKLLESINRGLQVSRFGVLILSPHYLEKGWTNYEMDILIRQHIETQKQLLPIWHGLTKQAIADRHPGLAGIIALKSETGLGPVVRGLVGQIAKGVATVAAIPDYESPVWRFLQGRGELKVVGGGTITLWEAVLGLKEEEYPLGVEDQVLTKERLLWEAAQILAYDPGRARPWLGGNGGVDADVARIWQMCEDAGFPKSAFP